MNTVALAALKLGLISPDMRTQFAQWGEVPDVEPLEVQNPGEVDELIERALQNDDGAFPKVTHLELIQQFCSTQRLGTLHLSMNGQKADFDVVFGVTRSGDIILPWRSEDIRDVLLDPENTFLTWSTGEQEHGVRFRSVEDSYYGDVKSFMICAPAALYKKANEHGDAS
jgi:hypothetical protein